MEQKNQVTYEDLKTAIESISQKVRAESPVISIEKLDDHPYEIAYRITIGYQVIYVTPSKDHSQIAMKDRTR